MNRPIRHVTVLGSGVMGSRIALLFAGIGVEVLLLDILPKDSPEGAGKKVRNKVADTALAAALKAKPAAAYASDTAKRITTGNLEDDLAKVAKSDWIIEVVVENLKIKQQLFEKLEMHRLPGTLITSNTSGIPIRMMAEGRSEDFRRHFCGTHFFNPPRYLRLLEIIPAPDTLPEVADFLMNYGEKFLGKTTVLAKDSPAFIANRVGVFGFMAVFKAMQELGLSVDEVDALTGPVMGRPKSATFRTADVVGLDTLVNVAKALPQNVPHDEAREIFQIPAFLEKMLERGMLGEKTKSGFYRKSLPPTPSGGGGAKSGVGTVANEETRTDSAEQNHGLLMADGRLYEQLKSRAAEMRKAPTKDEEMMWKLLRRKQLEDFKFRRQHVLGQYIADFVCLPKRLIIELDGSAHEGDHSIQHDATRTKWLEENNFKVIRFTNDEVLQNPDEVLAEIARQLQRRPDLFTNSNTYTKPPTDAGPSAFGEGQGEAAPFTASPEERGDEKKSLPLTTDGAPPPSEGVGGRLKPDIQTLNLQTLEYGPKQKTRFATIETAKPIESLPKRLRALYAGQDKAGQFYRQFHHLLFAYVSHRVPEIAEELYKIDDALKAGFGWEIGAFESWDALGVEQTLKDMDVAGVQAAPWVKAMLDKGFHTFYKTENGKRLFYNPARETYDEIPGQQSFIILENLRAQEVWKNSNCSLKDIGDGIVALSWDTKMNAIGGEVLEGIHKSIGIAEERFNGLVMANSGANFSAGANVGLIFLFAAEQEYDELDMAIRQFQQTTMRLRYSSIPVVVAPHGLTLGGGCELCVHADAVQAAAESYIGLVEAGVGLIPGGGGTKEMTLRAADRNRKEDVELNYLQEIFINIGTAKVGTSAHEAYDLGYLRRGYDHISMNPDRRIGDAKAKALSLWNAGYTQPAPRTDIKVQGRTGMGPLLAGIHGMWRGGYISDYDQKLAQKLAHVLCGGDLSAPTLVSEQYLLDLEREAFLSLCGERKTLERLQSILQTGKPLRN